MQMSPVPSMRSARIAAWANLRWRTRALEDVRAGARRVFIAGGKGGHQRLVPISARFFTALGAYLV